MAANANQPMFRVALSPASERDEEREPLEAGQRRPRPSGEPGDADREREERRGHHAERRRLPLVQHRAEGGVEERRVVVAGERAAVRGDEQHRRGERGQRRCRSRRRPAEGPVEPAKRDEAGAEHRRAVQVAPDGEQRQAPEDPVDGRRASSTSSQRQATKSRYARLCVRICHVLPIRQKNASGRSRSTLRCEAPRRRATTSANAIAPASASAWKPARSAEAAGVRARGRARPAPSHCWSTNGLAGAPDRPGLVVREPVVDDRASAGQREPRVLVDLAGEAEDERDREDRRAEDEQRLVGRGRRQAAPRAAAATTGPTDGPRGGLLVHQSARASSRSPSRTPRRSHAPAGSSSTECARRARGHPPRREVGARRGARSGRAARKTASIGKRMKNMWIDDAGPEQDPLAVRQLARPSSPFVRSQRASRRPGTARRRRAVARADLREALRPRASVADVDVVVVVGERERRSAQGHQRDHLQRLDRRRQGEDLPDRLLGDAARRPGGRGSGVPSTALMSTARP